VAKQDKASQKQLLVATHFGVMQLEQLFYAKKKKKKKKGGEFKFF
jgi:hypothetical protein